jgi:UDP-N-acetylmuramoyl-tripeptide--D-alanyl-D-alanine ligase
MSADRAITRWSFDTLLRAVGGEAQGLTSTAATFDRIECDSRKIHAGDLFWALVGERHDGHDFVAEALKKGACAAVVARRWKEQQAKVSGAFIVVDETLQALWDFAGWHRRQLDTLIVGVTGSVGKSTTRHMLRTVLGERFAGMESPANFNNEYGVPRSLLELAPDYEFAVLELGASAVGEIASLAQLTAPEIGIITAIAPAHLATFGTLDDICQAKGELLEALPETGFAVLNGDDELVRSLAARANCRVIFVGEGAHNDLVATKVRSHDRRLKFQIGNAQYQLPVVGRHHLTAALLSVAVARELGVEESEITSGLREFAPLPGRCRPVQVGPWTIIDDTYNSSPASVAAACQTLRDWQEARQRVLVLGDMLELGEVAGELHSQLGVLTAECRFDRVIAVGSQAATVAGTAKRSGMDAGCLGACGDLDTAALLLDLWLEPGDVVLVKGSRGMKMERVIEHLKMRAAETATRVDERKAA